jgi:hypothetical protein
MLWLVETQLSYTRRSHLCCGSPACLLNLRASKLLACQGFDLGFGIVAREIDFVRFIRFGQVDRRLRQRKAEDEPAAA